MRTQSLVGAAAGLICLLALLNLVAEHMHWQRGGIVHPRAELLHQTELRLETSASASAAPPPPLRTSEGALIATAFEMDGCRKLRDADVSGVY